MISPPDTRYAFNGDFALAYQILGDASNELMYLPGWVSNVEANWLSPDHARFLRRLSSFSRLIVTDRRGVGCSDRLSPDQGLTLEEAVEDLRTVARGAHVSRATVFGVEEGGFVAMLAAALHPERFHRLIVFGAASSWQKSDETPWAWSEEEWEDTLAAFRSTAPSEIAEGYIRGALPSYAADPVEVRRMAMLGDRACLALAEGVGATAVTTDARWADVGLDVDLRVIR